PSSRARLHGRAAEAIESAHASDLDAHARELAHHFSLAVTSDAAGRAFGYACRAAEAATRRSAFDEAAAGWASAVELLERSGRDDPELRARTLLSLAIALGDTDDLAAHAAAQERALAAAEATGDPRLVAAAALSYGRVQLSQQRGYGSVDDRVVSALR